MASSISLSQKVSCLIEALDRRWLIDEKLQVYSRYNPRWIFLSLLQPLYDLFSSDVKSHLCAHTVVQKLLQECRQHADISPRLLTEIKTHILDRLDRITHRKYHREIQQAWEKFHCQQLQSPFRSLSPTYSWHSDFP